MPNHSHIIMEKDHMDRLYKSKNLFVRFFHNQRITSILKAIPQKNKLKILDAGCGEGHLLEAIYKKNSNFLLYGCDITKIALASAKKRICKAKLSIQDLTKLKFPKEYFDIVICSDVLEHIYNYKEVILNLIRVTRKRGIIIISYPNENNLTISRFFLGIKPSKVKDHINSFNPKKMKEEFNIVLIKQLNLPLNIPHIPFVFSLEAIQVFKKK